MRRRREIALPRGAKVWFFDEAAGAQLKVWPPDPGFNYFSLTAFGDRAAGPNPPYANFLGAVRHDGTASQWAAGSSAHTMLGLGGHSKATFSLWYKIASGDEERYCPLWGQIANQGWVFRPNYGGACEFHADTDAGPIKKSTVLDSTTGVWVHWVAAIELGIAAGQKVRLYRDGTRYDGGENESLAGVAGTVLRVQNSVVWRLCRDDAFGGSGSGLVAEFCVMPGFAADEADAARFYRGNLYRGRFGLSSRKAGVACGMSL